VDDAAHGVRSLRVSALRQGGKHMRIYNSETFVRSWRKGEIDWNRYDAVPSPIAITCPECGKGLVLASQKGDKKTQSFIVGDMALLFPDDSSIEDMEKMFTDIIRPAFYHWLENQRKKRDKEKEETTQ